MFGAAVGFKLQRTEERLQITLLVYCHLFFEQHEKKIFFLDLEQKLFLVTNANLVVSFEGIPKNALPLLHNNTKLILESLHFKCRFFIGVNWVFNAKLLFRFLIIIIVNLLCNTSTRRNLNQ